MLARVQLHLAAPPERVFDAFLDPAAIARWFEPDRGEVVSVDVHPHVGGSFTIVQHRSDGDVETAGTYRELDRPHHLAFTWATSRAPHGEVTIDLEPCEHGTIVVLAHELDLQVDAEAIEQQWASMLDEIAELS